MKKKLLSVFACLMLCLLLLPLAAQRAEAQEYDHIREYDVSVQANSEDGSLTITADFEWEAVQDLPYGQELKIGIPNGSIRDVTPLTDNIERLDYDNSYMYVYLKDSYDAGEVFNFSYSWTQEYMYTLGDDGSVTYEYTPGWFDEISIDRMRLSWYNPEDATAQSVLADYDEGEWENDGKAMVGTDLPYGAKVTLTAVYTDWPTDLGWENSAGNLPPEYSGGGGYSGGDYYDDDDDNAMLGFVILVIIIVIFLVIRAQNDGYSGGFGTHYVYVGGLWYPSGHDGKPKPGSVGTKTKPHPPRSSSSSGFGGGGFGGGSRGGGFGGGGFGGGGGHCACASSCACACACACAGGGRAGCSAKNLYGAVHLSEELTEELK